METDLRASRSSGGASGGAGGELAGLTASALAGGGAALLSALVGLLAGVPFGALILRALVGGLLVAALVFAAGFLLRRLLPELFGPGPEAEPEPQVLSGGRGAEGGLSPAESSGLLGRNVDIVLPGGSEEEGLGSPLAAEPAELGEELDYDGASLLDSEDSPATRPVLASAALPQSGSSGFEDLDVLPDLESLSDSFLEMHPGGNGYSEAVPREGSSARSAAPASSYSSATSGGGSDPAVLAQAVRTLLKRDQKG